MKERSAGKPPNSRPYTRLDSNSTYTAEQAKKLRRDCEEIAQQLESLNLYGLTVSRSVENKHVRKHLTHGVGRRLGVIQKSLQRIFALFPPSSEKPLPRETLTDVQIYLHAFVINVSGIFDNWAWAFVLRHDLLEALGDRRNVGAFKKQTQRFLPGPLKEYLSSSDIASWHEKYAKEYRDALAHRIPVYIPPASWTGKDVERYQELETEKLACIQSRNWERLDEVWDEQDAVGLPCMVFMHEFSANENARPVYLHPQLLCDGSTVVDFGKRFYAVWHDCASPSRTDRA